MAGSKKAQELAEQLLGLSTTVAGSGLRGAQMGGTDMGAGIGGGSAGATATAISQKYGGGFQFADIVAFYQRNRVAVLVGGAAVGAVLAGVIGYYIYRKNKKDEQ